MDNREALKTFMTGENFYLQHYLGAHREELNGEHGYTFRVWAPNAQAVHLLVILPTGLKIRFQW